MLETVSAPAIPKGQLRRFLEPHSVREKQLEGMAAFLRWASWAAVGRDARELPDGTIEIQRSVPQIAKALGLPEAPTVKLAHQRYRNQIYRWVDYLAWLGIGAQEAPPGRRGQDTGILVRIPAGVAQSVRAAES
jgi:hypothetical protein